MTGLWLRVLQIRCHANIVDIEYSFKERIILFKSRKFPFVRQHDIMQCGVACLTMVCRYFGLDIELDDVGELCFTSKRGTTLLEISTAAGELGLDTIAAKLTIDELAKCPMPCILYWDQHHFVVLYRTDGTRFFYIADPGKGLVKYSRKEFEQHWLSLSLNGERRGIGMTLQPSSNFDANIYHRKEMSGKGSWHLLTDSLAAYRKPFVYIAIVMFLGSMLQMVLPFLTQSIVDVGIKEQNIGFIWLIMLGEFIIVLGKTVMDFVRRRILLHISMNINIKLVGEFFLKLLRLPMAFFDTKLLGDLLQRMNDHNRVQTFLTTQFLGMAFSVLTFIVFGIVLLVYNRLVFIVFMLGSLVYAVWVAVFLGKRKILDYELFDRQGECQNKTYQLVTSMQEIKLQNCEQRRTEEWQERQRELFDVQLKSLRLQQSQEGGAVFINELKNILVTVLSATAVINGSMTLGGMLAIQFVIGQLNSPVSQMVAFVYSLQDVKISLDRINEVHLRREEDEGCKSMDIEKTTSDIFVTNLSFKYTPNAIENILDDISINIPKGKITAIVGASGCGKTTLIKLFLGYYKLSKGMISIGNQDLMSVNMKAWRRRCGVVMQDGVIFSESIARNIAVDDGCIDYERLKKAAYIANVTDFVERFPLKYDTIIGNDGIQLSKGQKQRILIARAVYKNPDYIFLDEATNSLDATNEYEIVDKLSEFYSGRTVVVVAHRMSTIRNAEQIIVMKHGRIVEVGTHDTLLANHAYYYELVKSQI